MSKRSAARAVAGPVFVGLFLATTAAPAAGPVTTRPSVPTTPDASQMKTWWADLEQGEPQASRALLNFSARPAETVRFLKDRLRPLKLEPDDLNFLLMALASDEETTWRPAFEQLQYLDPRLAKDLPTLMAEVTDKTTRTRLVEILSDDKPGMLAGKDITLRKAGKDGYNFFDGHGSWWAEHKIDRIGNAGAWDGKKSWTRATRAIVLLQHIGMPDAFEIIQRMTTGHPDAGPTKVAKEVMSGKTTGAAATPPSK